MFTFFYIMNDYGFKPMSLVFLNSQEGYFPKFTDVYSTDLPNFGNSNWGISDEKGVLNWGMNYETKMDARLFYTTLTADDFSACRWDPNDSSIPKYWRISRHTEEQICYTTESLLYAQSSYFITVIITQAMN